MEKVRKGKAMRLDTPQIVHSAQVWVCNDCGGHDPKSCGCNSTAHMEKMAAKKEANRQAARRSYEKAKQNQQPSHNETNVENIEESDAAAAKKPYQWGARPIPLPQSNTLIPATRLSDPEASAPAKKVCVTVLSEPDDTPTTVVVREVDPEASTAARKAHYAAKTATAIETGFSQCLHLKLRYSPRTRGHLRRSG
jgi:hypothetical protein